VANRDVENREAKVRGQLALARDRAKAEPLLAKLRGGSRWEDLLPRERRALSRGPLVEYLLEASLSFRFSDPVQMVDLASAACAVADRLDRRRYGRALVADFRARAWAELGNAYRAAGDFEAAGRALRQAQKLAGQGTRSASLLALLSELMGTYCVALRKFQEAIAFLEQARDSYQECKDKKGLERTLLMLAHTLGVANEPERAVITYLTAFRQMSPDSGNWLVLIHGLATYLVECGFSDLANSLVRRHQRLYKRSGRLNWYRLFWLQGRIATGLHEYGRAEGLLQIARHAFARVNRIYEASLVSLDLAWVYAQEGRRKEVILLVDQVLRSFKSLGIAREAYASLALLRKSCEQQRSAEVLCVQIEALAKLLPELDSPGGKAAKGE
jgi:tetratricopeptide (TPR) repeat protein